MNEENNLGVGNINVVETFYQPIKEQQKLYGDQRYTFFKENNVDPAELIGIQRDPNATLLGLKKDDPNKEENNPFFVKDLINFISDIPDQSLYRITLGGMNAARFGVNLLPTISRLLGSEPGDDRFNDITKFSVDLDNELKNGIAALKQTYKQGFEIAKGRDPNKASDFVSYIAQDYPYAAPIYKTLDKIGVPKIYSIPLSVGLSSGIAFDPKVDESSLFFDSAAIQGLKTYFNALPDTPEGEIFDRAYQTFEGTGLAAAIGPIINTAVFLKRNVPAFNKAIPGAAVATGSATAIGEVTDQTILNPKEDQNVDMQNQDQSMLDTIKGGIDQFGNKLTQIGGAIKKEFSGEAMANPLIRKGANELAPVFKSAVVDAIEKIPAKAPGNQILGTIKNIPGVTQQEMKWIGLDDFLKDKPSITKQEISDFIQANRLDVNEVMLPRTTAKKRTEEEIQSWFIDQNADFGESAYFAYRDIQDALAQNGGVRFDDIGFTFRNKEKKIIKDWKYNTSRFLSDANLWDDFYETGDALTFQEFKNNFKKTFQLDEIALKGSNDFVTDGLFEDLVRTFIKENDNFRYYHNFDNPYAAEIRQMIFNKEDFLSLRKYLDDKGYKIGKNSELTLNDNNLNKLHNEYVIRVNEDRIENSYEFDFRDIENFIGGTTSTKYSRYTLPEGKDYKELIFTLSKGGKNVGKDFPIQQGATTKQTAANLDLDTSAHFNIPGEFAHVRFKERDIAGQKTLAVEELQSDIFQQVKQENKRIVRQGKQNASIEFNAQQNATGIFENVTEQDILQKAKPFIEDNTIKDFPFKNNWYELVTRRLIRYAADNNFSAIAIPEGRVAAARYGKVGGFVDNIEVKVKTSYAQEELDKAAQSKGYEPMPKYTFNITSKKGDKVIEEFSYVDGDIYNMQKQFPKSWGMIGGDLENVLLHQYTDKELAANPFKYKFDKPEFIGEGRGKFELYDQAIPAYIKKYAKKWNAPVTVEQVKFREDNESINYIVLKITPEMKRSVQEKSQPLFNIVLPALTAGGGAKVISDSMRNNTISEPTKN